MLSTKNKEYGLRALLRNIKQLVLQVKANRELSLGTNEIRTHWREKQLNENINKIETLLHDGKIAESTFEGEKTVLFAKESLLYFRQYQRNRLLLYLTLMWFGWIVLLFLKIAGKSKEDHGSFKLYVVKLILFLALFILLAEYIGKVLHLIT